MTLGTGYIVSHFGTGADLISALADFCLAASIPVLLFKIRETGHEGVSFTTQLLHLLTFFTRYLDTFAHLRLLSIPNALGKIYLFFGTLLCIHFYLRSLRQSGVSHQAAFTHETRNQILAYAIPSLVLALAFHYGWAHFAIRLSWPVLHELAWTFSMYLAVFADVPQVKEAEVEAETGLRDGKLGTGTVTVTTYTALLLISRALYVPHWALRYISTGLFDIVSTVCAVTQIAVFAYLFRPNGPGRALFPLNGLSGDDAKTAEHIPMV